MVSPQRALRYPYNKVQGPPSIVWWTMMVSTTPTWRMEPTTSSLRAMSPNHQTKACGASIVSHIFQGSPLLQNLRCEPSKVPHLLAPSLFNISAIYYASYFNIGHIFI